MGRLRWGRWRGMLGLLLWIFVPGIAVGQWHSGGTLHAANGLAWQQADAHNRLATAADMVAAVAKGGATTIHYCTVEDVRPYAEQLAACIRLSDSNGVILGVKELRFIPQRVLRCQKTFV